MQKQIILFLLLTIFLIQPISSQSNPQVIRISPGSTFTLGTQTFVCEPGTPIGQSSVSPTIKLGCLCDQGSFSSTWTLKLYQYPYNDSPKLLQSLETAIPSREKCIESMTKYSQCR